MHIIFKCFVIIINPLIGLIIIIIFLINNLLRSAGVLNLPLNKLKNKKIKNNSVVFNRSG